MIRSELSANFCPSLGGNPVGKDSTRSMRTVWDGKVTSPMSVIIATFSPVTNAMEQTLTPELSRDPDSVLLLIDLPRPRDGTGSCGGSALALECMEVGDETPDVVAWAQTFARRSSGKSGRLKSCWPP